MCCKSLMLVGLMCVAAESSNQALAAQQRQLPRAISSVHETLAAYAKACADRDPERLKSLISEDSPYQEGYPSDSASLFESKVKAIRRFRSFPRDVQESFNEFETSSEPLHTVRNKEIAYVDAIYRYRPRTEGARWRVQRLVWRMRNESGNWKIAGMLTDLPMVGQAHNAFWQPLVDRLRGTFFNGDSEAFMNALFDGIALEKPPKSLPFSNALAACDLHQSAKLVEHYGDSVFFEFGGVDYLLHRGYIEAIEVKFMPMGDLAPDSVSEFSEHLCGFSKKQFLRLGESPAGQMKMAKELNRTEGLCCVGHLEELAESGKLHEACTEVLAENFNNEYAISRRLAAHLIGLAGHKSCSNELMLALEREDDTATRRTMVRAMGLIGDESFVPALEQVLAEDKDEITRIYAQLAKLSCEGRKFAVVDKI